MKTEELKNEIHNRFWPQIEYLIQNCQNDKKFNSNNDCYYENLRSLEAIKAQVEGYIRDLNTCKKIIDKHHNGKETTNEK